VSERIRVVRVVTRMNVGGPAIQVSVLARLDPARFETRLLAGPVQGDEADYVALRDPDLPVELVPGLQRAVHPGRDAQAFARLVKVIRSYRPHVVHTHMAKAGVLGRLAALACNVPVTIHTFHGHLLEGYFPPMVVKGIVATERALAKRTTKLVSIGERVRDELLAEKVGTPDRYVVAAPAVRLGPSPDRATARALLGLPPDQPIVGFLGRLTGVKRPDRFVAAALVIAQKVSDVCFVVVGDGDLGAQIREQARPLGDRIHFLGWRHDVEVVHAAVDLMMLTSDNEGMPVSLIEASLCGRAAVTTDVGSAREVVVDGVSGFVVPPDPTKLAEAAVRILCDASMRAAMEAGARRHAEATFGPRQVVKGYEDLYETLLAAVGAPNSGRRRQRPASAAGS
jgi:glycosyltransferase involved in cell wall biosynthesis